VEGGVLQKPSVAMETTVLKPVTVPKYIEFRAICTVKVKRIP
jgi:hypothetical protein